MIGRRASQEAREGHGSYFRRALAQGSARTLQRVTGAGYGRTDLRRGTRVAYSGATLDYDFR